MIDDELERNQVHSTCSEKILECVKIRRISLRGGGSTLIWKSVSSSGSNAGTNLALRCHLVHPDSFLKAAFVTWSNSDFNTMVS